MSPARRTTLFPLAILLFSVGVAFRPSLIRPWCLLLIGFHVMTRLTMGILFVPATAVLVVLAIFSPFPPHRPLSPEQSGN